MLSLCEDILRKSFRTHQIKSKNIYGLFIKQFLSYSIEQYLSNYQINEGQKKYKNKIYFQIN